MVTLEIRDVPREVRDALAAQAEAQGQSFQAYLLELLETRARHGTDGGSPPTR
ncbi:FitA-like ribbon-helix-helix domain-containing protein [Micromonospora sp. IBSANI012]|uniref:FitA-like ribbon-helix-helix domain-containing protein n=1 Tax=Micromonospora sp. IBSANI012 TaxID=3457761 RepID=UPI00405A3F65